MSDVDGTPDEKSEPFHPTSFVKRRLQEHHAGGSLGHSDDEIAPVPDWTEPSEQSRRSHDSDSLENGE